MAKTRIFLIIIQNNLLYIYSGLKYKFCKNLNKFGPEAFALALDLLNDNKIHVQMYVLQEFLIVIHYM